MDTREQADRTERPAAQGRPGPSGPDAPVATLAYLGTGRVDAQRLAAALDRVAPLHPALRAGGVETVEVPGTGWGAVDRALKLAEARAAGPARPADGPLLSAVLHRWEDGTLLVVQAPGTAVDGAALPVLEREIEQAYAAGGPRDAVPENTAAAHLAAHERVLATLDLGTLTAEWSAYLGSAPVLDWPAGGAGPSDGSAPRPRVGGGADVGEHDVGGPAEATP
ncbi:hypothetical protein ACFC1R_18610, partial [Kitasatospora sp. NPDC056138]